MEQRHPVASNGSERTRPDFLNKSPNSMDLAIEAKKSLAKTEKKSAQKSAPVAKKKPQTVRA